MTLVAGGDGTGNYIFNEIVTGSTSGTQARVKKWDITTNTLEVSIITGDFYLGRESLVKTQELRTVLELSMKMIYLIPLQTMIISNLS